MFVYLISLALAAGIELLPARNLAVLCSSAYLDKTGTSRVPHVYYKSQVQERAQVGAPDSFVAERAGFEPAVRFDPHTAFPVANRVGSCPVYHVHKDTLGNGLRQRRFVN